MASFVQFQDFKERLGKGEFNFSADTLKVALSNTAPNPATMSVFSDITEITPANGYPAGGIVLANVTFLETGGIATLDADDVVIAASGGAIAQFQHVIIYDDSAVGKPLIQFGTLANPVDLSDGESQTLQWNDDGLLRIGA